MSIVQTAPQRSLVPTSSAPAAAAVTNTQKARTSRHDFKIEDRVAAYPRKDMPDLAENLETRMLALNNPWAYLIMIGVKKIEYRTQKRGFESGMRIVIYVTKSKSDMPEAETFMQNHTNLARDMAQYEGKCMGTVLVGKTTGSKGDFQTRLSEPLWFKTPLVPSNRGNYQTLAFVTITPDWQIAFTPRPE
jgi:hypothetical protein